MKKKVLFLILILHTFSFALTEKQIKNLEECIKITKIFNNPIDLVCPIMLNETTAKENKKIGDKFLKPFNRSYGLMQVRFKTAKFLINYFNIKMLKKMPDEAVLVRLIEDKRFNIAMANLYIKFLRKKYKDDIKKVVIAYNSGYYNPKNKKYWNRFLKNRKIFRQNFE